MGPKMGEHSHLEHSVTVLQLRSVYAQDKFEPPFVALRVLQSACEHTVWATSRLGGSGFCEDKPVSSPRGLSNETKSILVLNLIKWGVGMYASIACGPRQYCVGDFLERLTVEIQIKQ